MAFKTAIIITPTSAKIASHIFAIPNAAKIRQRNFIPIAKRKIKTFYLERQKEDDLIISASPFFLVNAICRDIGIHNIIGTEINQNTGEYINDNVYCFGEAKVKYFQKYFQGEIIEQFYSDSKCDEPLAKLSKEAYIVNKHKIKKWF